MGVMGSLMISYLQIYSSIYQWKHIEIWSIFDADMSNT